MLFFFTIERDASKRAPFREWVPIAWRATYSLFANPRMILLGVALFGSPIARVMAAFDSLAPRENSVFGISEHDRHAAARIAVWRYPKRGLVQLDIRGVACDFALKAGDH